MNSIYVRALAQNPSVKGHNVNVAKDGSKVDDLPRQVHLALTVPLPDLFLVQAFDNDIRCDGNDDQNYQPYGTSFAAVLATINNRAPNGNIVVVGVWATVATFTDVARHMPVAVADNHIGGRLTISRLPMAALAAGPHSLGRAAAIRVVDVSALHILEFERNHVMSVSPLRRPVRLLTVAVVMVVVVAACSDDQPVARPQAPSATNAVSRGAAPLGSGATSSFSTRFFDPPLDIDLPSFLDPTPSDEAAHLVSWGSPDGSVVVRVLRPVVVYAPGATTTSPVPTDYVRYLLGQADHGGRFVDQLDTEVGGREATVLTGTTDEPIDGVIGCPDTGTTAGKCFGLQPEFVLRIAVIATDQGPVLIWLRSNVDAAADVAAASERLDSFLGGVHFADRPVETATTAAAVDSEYDGIYNWTITKEDALAYGTPSDKTPESLALYPNTFTATLKNGKFTLRETSSGDEESDRYVASPGRLILDPTGSGLTAAVTRDPDGTLHLTASPPILDAGGVFILTTKPWVPDSQRG